MELRENYLRPSADPSKGWHSFFLKRLHIQNIFSIFAQVPKALENLTVKGNKPSVSADPFKGWHSFFFGKNLFCWIGNDYLCIVTPGMLRIGH